MKKITLILLLIGYLYSCVVSQGIENNEINSLKLLITKPSITKNKGAYNLVNMSEFIHDYVRLKLKPVNKISVVSSDNIYNLTNHYSIDYKGYEFDEQLKKISPNLILVQELDNVADLIQYNGSLIEYPSGKKIAQITTDALNDTLDVALRNALGSLLQQANITMTSFDKTVFNRVLLSKETKNIDLFISELRIFKKDPSKSSSLETLHKNDPGFSLLTFVLAENAHRTKNHHHGSSYYNHLLLRNGIYYSDFYVKASYNFRQIRSYEKASWILNQAALKKIETADILIEKAMVAKNGDIDINLKSLYEKVLRINPNHPDGLLYFAQEQTNNKLYAKSDELLNRISSKTYEVYLLHCKNNFALGKLERAEKYGEQAYELNKNHRDILEYLGHCQFALKKYTKAAISYEKVLQLQSTNQVLLLKIADCYKRVNNHKKALDVLLAYKKHFYDSKIIPKEIGLLYYQLDSPNEAKPYLEAAQNIEPADGMVYLALGELYSLEGNKKDAEKMFEKAYDLVDDKLQIDVSLSGLYIKSKQYTKAEKHIKKVIAKKPSLAQINFYHGELLYAQKKYTAALSSYLKERRLHGNNKNLQYKIASIYFNQKKYSHAHKETSALITMDPQNGTGYFQMAMISLQRKKMREAEEYIQKAESYGSIQSDVYKELAILYEKQKKWEKAELYYRKYTGETPTDIDAQVGLVKTLLAQNKQESAAQTYEIVYNQSKIDNREYIKKAGDLYSKNGNKEDAKRCYESYVSSGGKDLTVAVKIAQIEYEGNNYEKVINTLQSYKKKSIISEKLLAFSLYKSGNKEEALPFILNLLKRAPRDKEILEMAAMAYEEQNNIKKAVQFYERYLLVDKKNSNYAYRLGELYETINISKAIARYRINIRLYAKDVRNYDKAISLYGTKKQYKNAISVLKKAIDVKISTSRHLKKLVSFYLKINNSSQALVHLKQYQKQEPSDKESIKLLGILSYKSRKFSQAEEYLSQFTESENDEEAHYYLGKINYQKKNYKRAEVHFSEVSSKSVFHKESSRLLTLCYKKNENTKKLIESLEQKIEGNPKNYSLHVKIAKLYEKDNKRLDARNSYIAAHKLQPKKLSILLEIIQLFNNSPDEQIIYINKALKLSPHNANLLASKGYYYFSIGEVEKSEKTLSKLIKRKPSNHKGHFYLSRVFEQKGNIKKALRHGSLAVRYNKRDKKYTINLASLYYKDKKYAKGLQELKTLGISDSPKKLRGLLSYYTNKYGDAITYLKDQSLDDNTVRKALSFSYIQNGNIKEGINILPNEFTKELFTPAELHSVGNILVKSGNYDKAQKICEHAVQFSKEVAKYNVTLGYIYYCQNNETALRTFLAQHTHNSKNKMWYKIVGAYYLLFDRDLKKAERHLKRYGKNKELVFYTHGPLGEFYAKQEKFSKAISSFLKITKRSDRNNLTLANAYLELNNTARAQVIIKNVTSGVEGYYITQSRIYLAKKDYKKAKEILSDGIRKYSNSGTLHYLFGKYHIHNKNYDNAIESFKEATKNDNSYTRDAYKEIGTCYLKKGKKLKARWYYKKFLREGGNEKEISKYLTSM